MSKKSKRARARQRSLDRRLQPSSRVVAERTPATVQDSKSLAAPSGESLYAALSSRYQYVLPELRGIGIIAGILFLALIILSFVLR
ncbi:MAG: hypothetical protein FJZ83_00935 [Chloroflexi bacterium]|nr:hypothetical protein [Chloroflexota bacterium]MBM3182581.1 hypothetical protein [Chloroflexota bacterium]MBM4451288.1 hypothetical protein [Chloroflexota bacterium]MBM4453999.1 hypothetical protein [Chloroflexota bacterium]